MAPDDRYRLHVGGDLSGQVAMGRHNTVQRGEQPPPPVHPADLAALRAEFARVRAQLPAADPDTPAARERLDELEAAVTAAEPDLTTIEYVRAWFARRLPALAGSVAGLVLHPIVGRLVEAAGDVVAAEFRRRFGRADPAD